MELNLAIAILAGLGSFFAPCVLPIVPAFLAYISGTTVTEFAQQKHNALSINRLNIILNSIFFVLGFSVAFSIIGVLINNIFLEISLKVVDEINQVGGLIIVGFGAFLLLSSNVPILNKEKRFLQNSTKVSYPMSFVFGLAFAAGWTPCVGPILGTILTLASTTPSLAFNLLLVYSMSLGIPFIVMGVFFSKATKFVSIMSKHLKFHSVVVGSFIIVLGVLVYTNQLSVIASFPFLNELVLLG